MRKGVMRNVVGLLAVKVGKFFTAFAVGAGVFGILCAAGQSDFVSRYGGTEVPFGMVLFFLGIFMAGFFAHKLMNFLEFHLYGNLEQMGYKRVRKC